MTQRKCGNLLPGYHRCGAPATHAVRRRYPGRNHLRKWMPQRYVCDDCLAKIQTGLNPSDHLRVRRIDQTGEQAA